MTFSRTRARLRTHATLVASDTIVIDRHHKVSLIGITGGDLAVPEDLVGVSVVQGGQKSIRVQAAQA